MDALNTTRGRFLHLTLGVAALGGLLVSGGAAAVERFNISNDSYCVAAETGSDCDGYEQWKTYRTQASDTDSSSDGLLRIAGWAFTEPAGTNDKFARADLMDYGGGTGMVNADIASGGCGWDEDCGEGSSPEHAIDNNERDEFVLVEFDSDDWALTHVGTGWSSETNGGTTVDLQIWYWDGTGGPGVSGGSTDLTANSGGRDLSGTDLTGWTLLGDHIFNEGGTDVVSVQSTTTPTATSKYWLVAPTACNYNDTCGSDPKSDHFKLNLLKGVEVAGTPPDPGTAVPEPGTALLLLAMLPFASRRVRERMMG